MAKFRKKNTEEFTAFEIKTPSVKVNNTFASVGDYLVNEGDSQRLYTKTGFNNAFEPVPLKPHTFRRKAAAEVDAFPMPKDTKITVENKGETSTIQGDVMAVRNQDGTVSFMTEKEFYQMYDAADDAAKSYSLNYYIKETATIKTLPTMKPHNNYWDWYLPYGSLRRY